MELIANLISALNGGPEDMKDADDIYKKIVETGDKELIEKANYIRSVL